MCRINDFLWALRLKKKIPVKPIHCKLRHNISIVILEHPHYVLLTKTPISNYETSDQISSKKSTTGFPH